MSFLMIHMQKGCKNMEHKEREVDTSHIDDRDLGKIGGGRIPKGRTPGGMATSDSTVNGGENTQGVAGPGEPIDRGRNDDVHLHNSSAPPAVDNAMHQPVGGTLGGRNPGQQNAEIGDRDRPRGRQEDNDTTIDPMTSRAPNKVNEQL